MLLPPATRPSCTYGTSQSDGLHRWGNSTRPSRWGAPSLISPHFGEIRVRTLTFSSIAPSLSISHDANTECWRRSDRSGVQSSRSDADYFFFAAALSALGTGILIVRVSFLVSIGAFDLLNLHGRPLGSSYLVAVYGLAALWPCHAMVALQSLTATPKVFHSLTPYLFFSCDI